MCIVHQGPPAQSYHTKLAKYKYKYRYKYRARGPGMCIKAHQQHNSITQSCKNFPKGKYKHKHKYKCKYRKYKYDVSYMTMTNTKTNTNEKTDNDKKGTMPPFHSALL